MQPKSSLTDCLLFTTFPSTSFTEILKIKTNRLNRWQGKRVCVRVCVGEGEGALTIDSSNLLGSTETFPFQTLVCQPRRYTSKTLQNSLPAIWQTLNTAHLPTIHKFSNPPVLARPTPPTSHIPLSHPQPNRRVIPPPHFLKSPPTPPSLSAPSDFSLFARCSD